MNFPQINNTIAMRLLIRNRLSLIAFYSHFGAHPFYSRHEFFRWSDFGQ